MDPFIPHGNTKRNSVTARPYIKTAKRVLEEEDLLLQNKMWVPDVYESLPHESGGPLHSTSQFMGPRSLKQIHNRKSALSGKEKRTVLTVLLIPQMTYLISAMHAQKTHDFIDSIIIKNNAYYVVLKTDEQIIDIVKCCCVERNASVLGVDTTL